MLTNALRVLVDNLFKESFYGKKKINILIIFFISNKNGVVETIFALNQVLHL